jgi:hypothetical protein
MDAAQLCYPYNLQFFARPTVGYPGVTLHSRLSSGPLITSPTWGSGALRAQGFLPLLDHAGREAGYIVANAFLLA